MGETLVAEKKVLQRGLYRNDMLKLLAIVTMLIDHIGYMYFPGEMLFRTIGRLAFPIFAYQIALGYSHTSNLKKYISRIFSFALITHIPYSFFSPDLTFNPFHFNVLFTFVVAIGLLRVYDMGILKIKAFIQDKNYKQLLIGVLLLVFAIIIIILPEVISFIIRGFYLEYGMLALILVLLFHVFEDKKKTAIISIVLLYLLHGYYRVALFNSQYSVSLFWNNLLDYTFIWNESIRVDGLPHLKSYYFNARGVFALIPIYLLEGLDTSRLKLNKYAAYIFYPAHMALLVVIGFIIKSY
jgi:hypothetical protein